MQHRQRVLREGHTITSAPSSANHSSAITSSPIIFNSTPSASSIPPIAIRSSILVPTKPPAQHSNVASNSRPTHLFPLVNSSSSQPSSSRLPERQTHSPSLESDRADPNLRRRISELELENDKLRRHVQQAEDSIRNYRGFLSNRSNTASSLQSTRDFSTQTESSGSQAELLTQLRQSDERIRNLEKNNFTLQRSVSQMQNELTTVSRGLKDAEESNQRIMTDNEQAIRALSDELSAATSKVSHYERLLQSQSNISLPTPTPTPTQATNNSLSSTLQMQIKALKHKWKAEKESIQTALRRYEIDNHTMIKSLQEQLNYEISKSVDKTQHFEREFARQATIQQEQSNQIQSYERQLRELHESLESLRFENLRLESEIHDFKSKDLSSFGHISTTTTTTPAAAAAGTYLNNSQSSHKQITPQKLSPLKVHQACDPISPLVRKMDIALQQQSLQQQLDHERLSTELRGQIQLLQVENQTKTQQIEDLMIKLSRVSHQVEGINDRHALEVKTAQHLAHVKDLGRISAMREITLERDGLLADLRKSREIANILQFSLGTAEQSLSEILPQVVNKLREGRQKRLQAIEIISKEQKKDIEQRSVETCIVSSTHLEDFLKKATTKFKLAQEEWKEYSDHLKSLCQ